MAIAITPGPSYSVVLSPPVIDTYQRAAIIYGEDSLRVYFNISEYNTSDDIRANMTQVTVVDQESNLSVLNPEYYPSQVMLKEMQYDASAASTGYPFYIEIDSSDGDFVIDKFYKVQIRFTSIDVPASSVDPSITPQQLDTWLTQYQNSFSEWSRVTLIRFIPDNRLFIEKIDVTEAPEIPISFSEERLNGELNFLGDTKEYLSSYRICIANEDNELIEDSGLLYTDKNANNKNAFEYEIKAALEIDGEYGVYISYETSSLYQHNVFFTLLVTGDTGTDRGFVMSAKENPEEAEINIRITRAYSAGAFTGNIAIKRASSKDNFSTWETVQNLSFSNIRSFNYNWADRTVESGILYKYALFESYKESGVSYTYSNIYDKILMLVFEDMFITDGHKQLKIKFNPQVSSFRRNISEGKIETIGSQYPYIRRNAVINYALFPIAGLISCQMDENENFITKENLYGGKDILKKYERFNSMDYNMPFVTTVDNDFVYEKKFRDEVIKFLMNGEVKLFKSPTEGNFLVRLTDISFSPNQQLGRMIWSFNATANEIADNTTDNYYLYNILWDPSRFEVMS